MHELHVIIIIYKTSILHTSHFDCSEAIALYNKVVQNTVSQSTSNTEHPEMSKCHSQQNSAWHTSHTKPSHKSFTCPPPLPPRPQALNISTVL